MLQAEADRQADLHLLMSNLFNDRLLLDGGLDIHGKRSVESVLDCGSGTGCWADDVIDYEDLSVCAYAWSAFQSCAAR